MRNITDENICLGELKIRQHSMLDSRACLKTNSALKVFLANESLSSGLLLSSLMLYCSEPCRTQIHDTFYESTHIKITPIPPLEEELHNKAGS